MHLDKEYTQHDAVEAHSCVDIVAKFTNELNFVNCLQVLVSS